MSDKKFFIHSSDLEIKSTAKTEKDSIKIAGYANTVLKDRTGDIVLPEAWAKGIENYRKNPVLLYQHDHSKPIGKSDIVRVDKKGIFVEASVSSAAEKMHGVQSLIRDGALKSFSVGFRVKDASYDKNSDTFFIKDLELLEISVVSVPANQDSLFSVRKSFEDDNGYEEFKKQFITEDAVIEDTTIDNTSSIDNILEIPAVEESVVQVKELAVDEVSTDKASDITISEDDDPHKPIPFYNLLSAETSSLNTGDFVRIQDKRYNISKIATAESPYFIFKEVDIKGVSSDNTIKIYAENLSVANTWDINTKFDLELINHSTDKELTTLERSKIKDEFDELINASELDLFNLKASEKVKSSNNNQVTLNNLINLKSMSEGSWSDTHYILAKRFVNTVKTLTSLPEEEDRNFTLQLNGYRTENKENKQMATQDIGDPITVETKSAQVNVVEEKKVSAHVSEPRVAELVEKTGEKIIAQSDEKIKHNNEDYENSRVSEELAELRGQMKAYRDQIQSYTDSKMVYQENTRKHSQFSQKDLSNAYFLSKALRKSPLDTNYGMRMKDVVQGGSVSAFENAFSTNVYEEMRQQLVVAPLFNRIEVSARQFSVPVASEDTDDDIAQFESGTYTTDTNSNVPTSNQHVIKSVEITPHKFMVKTHIAKDEEEDTLLPLVDFLRAAATRRMARFADKVLLRGTGLLTGFDATESLAAGSSNASIAVGIGGVASPIKGIVNLAGAITALNVFRGEGLTGTAANTAKANAATVAATRAAMGKYGLALGENLVLLTTVEGYNNFVTESDFQTVDKFGSQATYLTGSLGAIYGIPLYITEFLDSASSTASNRVLATMLYKPGFLIGERRAMEVESEYLPERQVTAMYMSTRFDMKALTTEGSAALSSTYAYAANILSGASA
jgi:HK97 family phage prohead protease/HK97 family phage major capsid protein